MSRLLNGLGIVNLYYVKQVVERPGASSVYRTVHRIIESLTPAIAARQPRFGRVVRAGSNICRISDVKSNFSVLDNHYSGKIG